MEWTAMMVLEYAAGSTYTDIHHTPLLYYFFLKQPRRLNQRSYTITRGIKTPSQAEEKYMYTLGTGELRMVCGA